jgi:RNA polymerase sigma-70 factor (ECF subfamily)
VRIPTLSGDVEIVMENPDHPSGAFDARYLAFLETIVHLRPSLHRYCSRMTGSVLDGEDVVQEALFEAYRKLDRYDDARPLSPWLFQIAHNRCIAFLRRRKVRVDAETEGASADVVLPHEPPGAAVGRAVEHLVLVLPPKERACVLLKDVFDYSLEEIADLVGSTVGGVKAALHRARAKLASSAAQSASTTHRNDELMPLVREYVHRFNERDWDGLRQLIAADARVHVADRFSGLLADSPYFGRYARLTFPLRAGLTEVDGDPAVIVYRMDGGSWMPQSIVRLEIENDRIARVVDYNHCPWVLQSASIVGTAS